MLEHHPDLAPHLLDVLEIMRQLDTLDHDLAALMLLQAVDAADHGRFAGAGRAAHHDALAFIDRQVDVLEDVELAVPLVDVGQLDHHVGADLEVGAADGLGCGLSGHDAILP